MFILEGKAVFTRFENNVEKFSYTFNALNDAVITKSVDDLIDTAVIKLPTKFKVRQNGQELFTEEALKVGDKVTITLGYQDKYSGVEFAGYVKKISSKIPLVIECEDAMWLLRRKSITKSFGKTTMKEVLKEVVKGTGIELDSRCANIDLEKWVSKAESGAQVLERFKKNLLMTSFITDEGKLYCGLKELTNIGNTVVYDLNYNIVENNLDYKSKDDRRIKLKYIYIDKANKKKSIEVGDSDGEERTYHTSVVSDMKKLTEMANFKLNKLKYDGFDGDVKSFLIPYATRGMTAKLVNSVHKNREGNYFIEKVVTIFSRRGARRTVSISNKL